MRKIKLSASSAYCPVAIDHNIKPLLPYIALWYVWVGIVGYCKAITEPYTSKDTRRPLDNHTKLWLRS